MPNWKKVIVSGSDAVLNSVYANSITSSIFSGSSFSGSFFGTSSWAVSSSYAVTALYALNGGGGGTGGTPLYIHTQSVASTTWTVNHNLGTLFPIITVYDPSYNVVIPQEITSTNISSLSITFPLSIAGYASVAGTTFTTGSGGGGGVTQEQSIINALIFG